MLKSKKLRKSNFFFNSFIGKFDLTKTRVEKTVPHRYGNAYCLLNFLIFAGEISKCLAVELYIIFLKSEKSKF